MKTWLTRVGIGVEKLPKKYTIGGAVVFVALIYGAVFFIDKPVVFSYAGATCVKHLTLLPTLQQASKTDRYKTITNALIKIGEFPLIGSKVCFKVLSAPQEGIDKVSISPFGGGVFRKTFAVTVKSPPAAHISVLNKQIPTSRPLQLPLSEPDTIFTYSIKANDQKVGCKPKGKTASCDLKKLNLAHGTEYPFEVVREFKTEKVATIAKKTVTTLPAVKVTNSSLKPDETVFAKPKTIELTFDKNITKAAFKLVEVKGNKRQEIPAKIDIQGEKVSATIENDLPRSASFEVVMSSVEANDGSGLEDTYKFAFKTSGGPKVTGVNVPKTGVATGTTMTITFDQPLSDKQDLSKIVGLAGGAVIKARIANQLHVALGGVPKCGDFTVAINNDLQSNYDIGGNTTWGFTGRMKCHAVSTIGYSSKGRAIQAYHFGGGPATVLYTGAIHGNELSTKYLMEKWIDELEANARAIPANKSVVVVPSINPDGVASGTRTNARNVDLNRNFATSDWKRDTTTVNNTPFPNGGGPEPLSEPETRALAAFAQRLQPRLVLSYHSIGGVVAGNQAGNSSALTQLYSQLSGYQNTTGQTSETFEYSVSGTADDWYAEKLGAASIVIELGSHTNHQFSRNQKAMWAMLNS